MEDTTTAEPSIADLRGMLAPESDAPAAGDEATETPAPATKVEEKPAPASEPVNDAGKQRGADGKFVAAPADGETPREDPPGVAKRIGKALEAQRLAEERVQRLEEELARAKPGSQPKPSEKDFDSYADYVEALTDWKIDNQRAIDTQAANQRAAVERETATIRTWTERVAETVKVHSDYEAVMADAKEIPITPAMHDAILTMARGPEVAYYLAKHLDECERISKLGPSAAAVELGEIRASLAKPAAAAPAATKTAARPLPKPAASVGGSAAPHTVDLSDDSLDVRTFKREFQKRLKSN